MSALRTAKLVLIAAGVVVGIEATGAALLSPALAVPFAISTATESDSTFQILFNWNGTTPAAPLILNPGFANWNIQVAMKDLDNNATRNANPLNDIEITAMHLLHPAVENLAPAAAAKDGDKFTFPINNVDLAAALPGPTLLTPRLPNLVFKDLAPGPVKHDNGHSDDFFLSYRRAANAGPVDFQFAASHKSQPVSAPEPAPVWTVGLAIALIAGYRWVRQRAQQRTLATSAPSPCV